MSMSMTGYGRQKEIYKGYDITVELKSVNHRYFDANIRVPRGFSFLEEPVRKYLSEKINRGKLDVYIHMNNVEEGDKVVTLNRTVAENYLKVLKELSDEYDMPFDVSATKMSRFPDIFEVEFKEHEAEEIFSVLEPVMEKAVNDFLAMRRTEGKRLADDMVSRIEKLRGMVARIEELLPASVAEYEKKLRDKMEEYLNGATYDETRLMTEVAIFSDKVATFEETTRLQSHFEEFMGLVYQDKPVGKKLDFIIQEMNREINTTCSKCNSIEISKIGIDAKTEIEAIREQVQNVE